MNYADKVHSPIENYLQNNYINEKINNIPRTNTHSYDYYSSKNYIYKNGALTNNYDNFEPNNNYNNYINSNYYTNKNNSIKMDFDFDDNNILSKSSNNYHNLYSNSLINKKK